VFFFRLKQSTRHEHSSQDIFFPGKKTERVVHALWYLVQLAVVQVSFFLFEGFYNLPAPVMGINKLYILCFGVE
jgi:hypothetical protein